MPNGRRIISEWKPTNGALINLNKRAIAISHDVGGSTWGAGGAHLAAVQARAGNDIVLGRGRQGHQALGIAGRLSGVLQAQVREGVHQHFVLQRHHELVSAQPHCSDLHVQRCAERLCAEIYGYCDSKQKTLPLRPTYRDERGYREYLGAEI